MEAGTSSSTFNEPPASKRRRLDSSGTATKVDDRDDADLSDTLASGSTPSGSPSRKGKERQQVDEIKEEDMAESDGEGPLDDGDGLMADLSEEAKKRLAMRDADGWVFPCFPPNPQPPADLERTVLWGTGICQERSSESRSRTSSRTTLPSSSQAPI